MGLLDRLASGSLGVTLAMPSSLQIEQQADDFANLTDQERALGWYLFFYPGHRMDLEQPHYATLERDVRAHAVALFEAMRRRPPPEGMPPPPESPRHPLVSCERVELMTGVGLSVIHRMAYAPTNEIVMGHLLVPLRQGLFEARWIAPTKQTGMRESVLFAKAMAGGIEGIAADTEPEEMMKLLTPDDSKYDELFPDNVLTKARRAAAWSREQVRVTQPGIPIESDQSLETLGCDLQAPPRFALVVEEKKAARFHRISLAGNDGVQALLIERRAGTIEGASVALARRSETLLTELGAVVTSQRAPTAPDPLHSALVMEAELEFDRPRMVSAAFEASDQSVWLLTLSTTDAQPPEPLLLELAAVASSLRPHARPPWWKVWK